VILWAGDTIQNYEIAISTDNAKFTTVFTGTTKEVKKDSHTYTESDFNPKATGQYLRITGLNRWPNAESNMWGNSIYEISAYGRRQ
jgi:hypothetical protein